MKTVLLIDDDPEMLELLEHYLKQLNFVVVAMPDPVSVDAIRQICPGVILLDHNLDGDISGAELCIALKADPRTKTIPVILLSADERLPALAKNSCADAYLKKPFKIATLYQLIKQVTFTEPGAKHRFS